MKEMTLEELRDLYVAAIPTVGGRILQAVVRGFTNGTGLLSHVQRSDYPRLAAILRYLDE